MLQHSPSFQVGTLHLRTLSYKKIIITLHEMFPNTHLSSYNILSTINIYN